MYSLVTDVLVTVDSVEMAVETATVVVVADS